MRLWGIRLTTAGLLLTASAWARGVDLRPNMMIVIADDLSADKIGCYGNQDVRTPHIDQLAREGLLFTAAYTSTAMCAPSRAQFYTGLFPVRNGAFPNHSRVKPGVKSLPHYLAALGYRVGINGKRHYKPSESFPFEDVGGRRFHKEAIEEFIGRDRQQPFCLIFTSGNPHAPYTAGDASQYDAAQLTIPQNYVDTPETRQALAGYYAEVTDLDDQTGFCRAALERAGVLDETLFLFTSEQGAQFPGAKWTCYEDGLRVGLIARWPGKVRAGAASDAWVHYVDMVPTLLEAAGGTCPEGLDGRSFLNVLLGKTDAHRDVTYGVHTQRGAIGSPATGYPVRSIRVGSYKLIRNLNHQVAFNNAVIKNDREKYWHSWVKAAKTDAHAARLVQRYLNRPPEEFYDLDADPRELNNIIDAPAHRARIDDMRDQLQVWMAEQGDRGHETELAYQPTKHRNKRSKE